jgi:hypothetical protein
MSNLFEDQQQYLENIGRSLVANVPGPWRQIDAIVELFEDGSIWELSYVPESGSGEAKPFAIMDAVESVAFANYFQELANLLDVQNEGRLKKCRYQILASGVYHADYEY